MVWVSIVNSTGPTFASWSSLLRLRQVARVERAGRGPGARISPDRARPVGDLALAEGDGVDDRLAVDRVGHRLTHLRVIERLPLRVDEEEVVAEARFGRENDRGVATQRPGDLRVEDDRHVGGLRPERRREAGFVGHDVDPDAVEVRLAGHVVVAVRVEAHEVVGHPLGQLERTAADRLRLVFSLEPCPNYSIGESQAENKKNKNLLPMTQITTFAKEIAMETRRSARTDRARRSAGLVNVY